MKDDDPKTLKPVVHVTVMRKTERYRSPAFFYAVSLFNVLVALSAILWQSQLAMKVGLALAAILPTLYVFARMKDLPRTFWGEEGGRLLPLIFFVAGVVILLISFVHR